MDTRCIRLVDVETRAAPPDAAMINGHIDAANGVYRLTPAAPPDAAMINGHIDAANGVYRLTPAAPPDAGHDQWTLSVPRKPCRVPSPHRPTRP